VNGGASGADRWQRRLTKRAHNAFVTPIAVVLLLAIPRSLSAQPANLPEPGAPAYAYMETLLEKTIFRVDVLTLEVWIGGEVAAPLRALEGKGASDAMRDSVASLAVRARDAWAHITFERGVSLGQFVGGIEGNMRRAVEADLLSRATAQTILDSIPLWFSVLEDRGIEEGDRIQYRITGDTLRTRFMTRSGEILVDQMDIGPERRLSVFGSYFAPGSEFRKGLTGYVLDPG